MSNLVARVVTKFPSQAQGTKGIKVSQSNGIFTIEPDYSSLIAAAGITDPTKAYVEIWRNDLTPAQYQSYPVSLLAATLQASITLPRLLTAAPWNVQIADAFVAIKNGTAAAIAINLPAVASKVGPVTIKDASGNFGTYYATITPSAGEAIDGASTFVMKANYQALTFVPLVGTGYLVSG